MWKRLRELLKLAPEIKQVQVLRLQPGDVVILTAPGHISAETARVIKEHWERNFEGYKCAVLGDGIEVQKVLRRQE